MQGGPPPHVVMRPAPRVAVDGMTTAVGIHSGALYHWSRALYRMVYSHHLPESALEMPGVFSFLAAPSGAMGVA